MQGRPTVRTKVQFLPPPDFQAKSLADFMVLGQIMTAMPAINAIPAVVAYNRYSHDIERLANRFESFMEEFSNILHRQAAR